MKHYHLNKSHLNQDRLNQDSLVKYHCAKIFSYELRRLLANRFTPGPGPDHRLLQLLDHEPGNHPGRRQHRPLVPWSFGVYMARVMPLLLTALLFFISLPHPPDRPRAVGTLTQRRRHPAGPVPADPHGRHPDGLPAADRHPGGIWMGILCGSLPATPVFTALAAPLCFVLLPSASLVMGAGMLCGRHCPAPPLRPHGPGSGSRDHHPALSGWIFLAQNIWPPGRQNWRCWTRRFR